MDPRSNTVLDGCSQAPKIQPVCFNHHNSLYLPVNLINQDSITGRARNPRWESLAGTLDPTFPANRGWGWGWTPDSDPRLTTTRSGIPSGSRSPICQMQGIRRGSAQDGRIIMMEPADLPAGRRPAGGHWQKVPPGRPSRVPRLRGGGTKHTRGARPWFLEGPR